MRFSHQHHQQSNCFKRHIAPLHFWKNVTDTVSTSRQKWVEKLRSTVLQPLITETKWWVRGVNMKVMSTPLQNSFILTLNSFDKLSPPVHTILVFLSTKTILVWKLCGGQMRLSESVTSTFAPWLGLICVHHQWTMQYNHYSPCCP